MNLKPMLPLWAALIGATFSVLSPLLADESADMLTKARDLVQQVSNPQQSSSDAQRVEKLNQALTLTQQAPNHRLKGHRVKAIQDIRAAVAEIQKSDPDHKSADYLREVETELAASISLAAGTEGAQPASQPSVAPVMSATSSLQPPALAHSPIPVDAAAVIAVVTRFVANASSKPLGPVETEVTDQFLATFQNTMKMEQEEAPHEKAPSLRQAIAEQYDEFTLDGKVDLLFSEGPAAIVYGKATLTKDGLEEWKDDESSWKLVQNGKAVFESNENTPSFSDGGGDMAFVGPRIKDAHVVATFCLVQQHGQWKIHTMYFSNDVIGGSNKDFIIRQLTAFAAKYSEHPSTVNEKQIVTQPVPVQANPSGTIYGKLIDRGEPDEYGASINVQDVHPSKKNARRNPFVQRENNREKSSQTFTSSSVPIGADYAVVAWHGASFAISPKIHLDEKNLSQKVDMTIPEGKTLRRQFVDSEGKPAPGLAFEIDYTTPWGTGFVSGETGIHPEGTQRELVTDANGWLVLPHFNPECPGQYRLRCESYTKYVPIEILLDSAQTEQQIRVTKGKIVEGVLKNAATSQPISGVWVYALYSDCFDSDHPKPGRSWNEWFDCEARTDAEGHFRFSNLAEDEFMLHIRSNDYDNPNVTVTTRSAQKEPVVLNVQPRSKPGMLSPSVTGSK